MPTINGITFTDKQETLKFYDERWDEVYHRGLERFKGDGNCSELATNAANNEVMRPRCEKDVKGVCAGFSNYIVTTKKEIRKRFFWMFFPRVAPDTTEHEGNLYIRTPNCPNCSAFLDALQAGKQGRSIADEYERLVGALMTEEEKKACRPLIQRGYDAGAAILEKNRDEHGKDRYRPRGKRK